MIKDSPFLVSIVIATFNAGDEIGECLASIKQYASNTEIIVVDGKSSDNTLSVIESKEMQNLTVSSKYDKGIYDALNKGIAKSSGKWLYFMGADDRLLPDFQAMLTNLKDKNTVYYGNSVGHNETDPSIPDVLLKGEFSQYRLAKYCMNHQSVLYPREVFSFYQYELKYTVLADYALNLNIWGDIRFQKVFFPLNIVRYNMNGFSAQNPDLIFEKDKSEIIRKAMGFSIYFRYIFRALKDNLRGNKRI